MKSDLIRLTLVSAEHWIRHQQPQCNRNFEIDLRILTMEVQGRQIPWDIRVKCYFEHVSQSLNLCTIKSVLLKVNLHSGKVDQQHHSNK